MTGDLLIVLAFVVFVVWFRWIMQDDGNRPEDITYRRAMRSIEEQNTRGTE